MRMSAQERVLLVDEQDCVIGTEEKLKAHQLGLLHRAFSVFIYRTVGTERQLLLQQRHQDKYHCGGLWTNTCCSHPRVGENIVAAAERRLWEEMSLDLPLKRLGCFYYKAAFENGLTEHELDHVLIGEYDPTQPIILDPEEAQDYRWISEAALLEELSQYPERFTPWFLPALKIVQALTCANLV